MQHGRGTVTARVRKGVPFITLKSPLFSILNLHVVIIIRAADLNPIRPAGRADPCTRARDGVSER